MPNFVKFDGALTTYWVVPEKVVFLQPAGNQMTRIHLEGGFDVVVDGEPDPVGLKLQGRGKG